MQKCFEEKPVSGFAKKKALEELGCKFYKRDAHELDREWVIELDGEAIGINRLQGPAVDQAIAALGGL